MDIVIEDIALEEETVLNNRFLIKSVHYIGEQGITYIGIDSLCQKEVIIKEFMPYRIANRDMDKKSLICRSGKYKKKYCDFKSVFRNECECTKKIKNINKPYEGCVTKYIDSFEENNTLYLVIEKVIGSPLDECIEKLNLEDKYTIIKFLIGIILEIHRNGIFHCDIKPSNIIVRPDMKISLIDFGTSCKRNGSQNNIQYVSRGFSAPELYTKEKISSSTDIYSLGAVIYYILTGFQLPQADDIDDTEEIPRISEFVEISEFKEKAFMKMLERDKRKRLRSVILLYLTL